MPFSIAPLLVHSEAVPREARKALEQASTGPQSQRTAALELAARLIHRETDLDCEDARELVGLEPGSCG
jgi:hypothetical protein